MGDRQQVHENVHNVSEYSAKRASSNASDQKMTLTKVEVPFRLIAEFVVETAAEFLEEPDLKPEGRALLLTVLMSPGALNRLAVQQ